MAVKHVRLGWGLTEAGELQHIRAATRGKACACICPDCGTALIARQGTINRWHFQHSVEVACTGESALHRAAKQVLLQAVRDNDVLALQGLSGQLETTDLRAERLSVPWYLPARFAALAQAAAEVRLSPDLIVDTLLQEQSGKDLIVEVFVTHRKSPEDEAKYRSFGRNAIEIDLSTLEWDADAETIRVAVLREADRRWLHCSDEVQAIAEARRQLKHRKAERNAFLTDRLEWAVRRLVDERFLLRPSFLWPSLSRMQTADNAFGTPMRAEANEQPRGTDLHGALQQLSPTSWRQGIVVNGRSQASALFVLAGAPVPRSADKRPEIVIAIDPDIELAHFFRDLTARWRGIDSWLAKLQARADHELGAMLDAEAKKKAAHDQFAAHFRQLDDRAKLRSLAQRLDVACPAWPGKRLDAWNTTWAVWKGLVWCYVLPKHTNQYLDTRTAATDAWLAQLLGWPTDVAAVQQREKLIWLWLKRELEPLGLVRQLDRGQFAVASALPPQHVPWAKP